MARTLSRSMYITILFSALTLLSCGTTSGALVTMPFQAGGAARAAAGPLTFTNPLGWTITLTQAVIALGPFYVNAYPPDTQNFRSGAVILEATEQVVVDALDPALVPVPGGADGESEPGVAGVAVEIDLFPPDATQSSADQALLAGKLGLVAGTAVKGGVTLSFRGPIVISQAAVTATTSLPALERVNGAVAELVITPAPQQLTLRVDPAGWFDLADFGSLQGGAGTSVAGGVYTWDETSTFLNQLVQGVKEQAGIYSFSLAPR